MNWFEKHLNLTLTIWWVGGLILAMLAASIMLEQVWLPVVAYLVVLVLLDGWVLRQKDRSLGWLLLVLVGVGLLQIVILCMANNNMASNLISTPSTADTSKI